MSEVEQEKEEQVWKSFTHILENFHQIFGKEKLKMDDFLAILQAGMQASHYRTVPATVDVVNVKSYDLIEYLLQSMFMLSEWVSPIFQKLPRIPVY